VQDVEFVLKVQHLSRCIPKLETHNTVVKVHSF